MQLLETNVVRLAGCNCAQGIVDAIETILSISLLEVNMWPKIYSKDVIKIEFINKAYLSSFVDRSMTFNASSNLLKCIKQTTLQINALML